MTHRPLNDKQQAFVEHYLRTFNATQSAIAAGYSVRSAGSIGHDLLKNTEIDARIRERIAELTMAADEVLVRLAEHARGDIGELLDTATMTLDMRASVGKTRLIKKWKQTVITRDEQETVITEVELYDAQNALIQLGKANGALKEGVQTMRIQMIDELPDDELARIASGQ